MYVFSIFLLSDNFLKKTNRKLFSINEDNKKIPF